MTINGWILTFVIRNPFIKPEDGRDPDDREHSDRRRQMPFDEKDRKQNAEQRKDRTDRQIDSAGDDHDAETDAEYSVDADQPR